VDATPPVAAHSRTRTRGDDRRADRTSDDERVAPNNLTDWAERSRSFEAIGGFMGGVGGMVMAGADGMAETVSRQWVTATVFDALGVRPVAGRMFLPDDDRKRATVAVLSESFWRARYNGDSSIVGRDIRLDGENYTVVGVAPDAAQLIGRTNLWALIPISGAPPRARASHMFRAVGRLKPGVTLAAADADLSAVASALAKEYPKTNEGRGVTLEPFDAAVIGADLRQTSMLFLGVVAFVLLLCCANVANLLLARATARSRELAIRSAMGADRPRLIRQLLTESLVLSIVGGALGLALGAAILRIAPSVIPEGLLPPAVALAFDVRLVAFCAGAALLVGLLFGLAPAWQATALQSAQALAQDNRTTVGGGGRLAQRARGRRGGRRCSARRRRAAAAHAACSAEHRSRLPRRESTDDDGGPAGVGIPDARVAAAVLRRRRA
jgi:putative ABC transport system permease protein